MTFAIEPEDEAATLVGLLDGLLDQGVHVAGDLAIGLADVELVRVALRLLVASEDTVRRTGTQGTAGGEGHGTPAPTRRPGPAPPPAPGPRPTATPRPSPEDVTRRPTADEDDRHLADGVARLVLTVVAVLHDLIERQAIRRVEGGTLTDDQVERLGVALAALEERMADVREAFGVDDADLNLDLGQLGRLR